MIINIIRSQFFRLRQKSICCFIPRVISLDFYPEIKIIAINWGGLKYSSLWSLRRKHKKGRKGIPLANYSTYDFIIYNFLFREATKKKVKKFHNKCEISPKMENPPPSPYFTTILADFGT